MNSKQTGSLWLLAAAVALGGCASSGNPTPTSSVPVTSKAGARPATATGSEQVRAIIELDSLRREVALLRNQVEVQENELDKLRKRQRELYDDLDYRLRARERISGPRTPVASGPYPTQAAPGTTQRPGSPQDQAMPGSLDPAGAPGSPPGPYITAPATQPQTANAPRNVGAIPGSQQPYTTDTPGTPADQPQPPTQVAVATAAEQAAYDSAFEMLKQGRYGEAIAAFENMVAQYPNGALADDSQYWVGEAWYVTRDYERALGVFKEVVARYPDSPRVPEALLKIGYVQQEVGAKSEACRTFTDVINRYPGSRVAISAQTKRKRLELDGHCS